MTAAIDDVKDLGSAVMTPELAGVAELAALLGVSRQRVSQLAKTPGFPKPLATLAAGPVWSADDVVAWARETGRL